METNSKKLTSYIMKQIKEKSINQLSNKRQIKISKQEFPDEYKANINHLIGFDIIWE